MNILHNKRRFLNVFSGMAFDGKPALEPTLSGQPALGTLLQRQAGWTVWTHGLSVENPLHRYIVDSQ
jgi:hypothetical protein